MRWDLQRQLHCLGETWSEGGILGRKNIKSKGIVQVLTTLSVIPPARFMIYKIMNNWASDY